MALSAAGPVGAAMVRGAAAWPTGYVVVDFDVDVRDVEDDAWGAASTLGSESECWRTRGALGRGGGGKVCDGMCVRWLESIAGDNGVPYDALVRGL